MLHLSAEDAIPDPRPLLAFEAFAEPEPRTGQRTQHRLLALGVDFDEDTSRRARRHSL